ncbi:MAG: SPFH domain-containing protein [Planctomycetota bacterium]
MSKTIDVDGSSHENEPRRPRRSGGGDGFDPPWGKKGWGRGRGGGGRGPSDTPLAVRIAATVLVVVVITLGVLGMSGRLGVTRVEANEVAVRVNYLTGTETVVVDPGYQFYVPFLMDVYKFDGTTQEYVMAGDSYRSANVAPYLTVRANDGSNFWFDELKIQYEIIPGAANVLLEDSGLGDTYKQEWIKAYARSVLRDEFGLYSAVDAADPTTYKAAPEEARKRMNEILEPHGISVVRIITPNPQFDERYEHAIEQRKEADQEVEELRARSEQLVQEREQRLAAVRKEKEVEMQELRGTLTKALLAAEQEAIRVTRSADAFSTERTAEGRAAEARLTAESEGLVAKYTKEAEGIESRAQALEERGEVVVREALVEKLLGVRFTLIPYSRDPAPQRLEHSGNAANAGRLVPSEMGGQ